MLLILLHAAFMHKNKTFNACRDHVSYVQELHIGKFVFFFLVYCCGCFCTGCTFHFLLNNMHPQLHIKLISGLKIIKKNHAKSAKKMAARMQ